MSDKLTASIGSRNMLPLIILPLLLTFLFTNILTNNTYAASSLTVSGDAIINLSSLSTEGTFAKSGNIDITASTDSPSGYKLMIQANNSTSLVSGSNEITSLAPGTSISEDTFKNGNYNGKWGFKPSMFNSAANSNFLPSPSTTGDVINATSCANGTGSCPNEDNYTIAIGAKVNNTQPIGNYSNTFNIMMVSNGIEYSITYRNTKVSNMPEDVSGETEASTVTLASETPTREGYNFLGWCTVQPAVDGSCSGTSYSPGQQISTSAASNLSLYARWGTTSTGNTIATATYMQDVTSCPSSLPTGTQYTLIDKRDGKTYTAAKQADGKCWMTQNLDLDIGGEGTAMLTSENTNLTTSGSGAYVAGYRVKNGLIIPSLLDTAISTNKTYDIQIQGWCNRPTDYSYYRSHCLYMPYSIDLGDLYYYTSGSTDSDIRYNSLSNCTAAGHSTAECAHYHIGNHYSWPAAVVSNNTSSLSVQYSSAQNDICPKGWRLPIDVFDKSGAPDSAREMTTLVKKTGVSVQDYVSYADGGFNKIRTNPLYFVRSGTIDGTYYSQNGYQGFYWTNTVIDGERSVEADFSPTVLSFPTVTSLNNDRDSGSSVRCIVK